MNENLGKVEVSPSIMNEDTREIQVVEFILGENKYTINLFDVREIIESVKITPLPHTSRLIKGIIDLRGETTKILDLKKILNIRDTEQQEEKISRFIILDKHLTGQNTGIIVDDVTAVLTIPISDVDVAQHQDGDDSFILGIIKKPANNRNSNHEERELVIWIDVISLLRTSRLLNGTGIPA